MLRKQRTIVIDALRERTIAGQRRIVAKQIAERQKAGQDDKKLRQRMRDRAKKILAECVKMAMVASGEGESQVTVSVMRHENEPYPKWCQYLTQYTRELLEKKRFTVKVENGKMDPVGSDPMFLHTVYDTNLLISWDKSR